MNNGDGEREASLRSITDAFTRYRKQLAARVARIVKPYDVEDIVQETYLRLFQAAKREAIQSPRAFMLTTVRNLALNRLRSTDALDHESAVDPKADEESGDAVSVLEPVDERTPDSRVESEQEFRVLCQAIRALPRQCRRVFLLRRVYGLSQREVAARLGISERTVENHIAKAALACSEFMEARGIDRLSPKAPNRKTQARPL